MHTDNVVTIEAAPGTKDSERRTSRRIRVRLPCEVGINAAPAGAAQLVFAQLIDISADGRGAGLLVSQGAAVPLGGRISLVVGDDEPTIAGQVVSRLGTNKNWRLGVRIEEDSQALLQAVHESDPTGLR